MAVQACPYHNRIQQELNGLTEVVTELREWRAAEEVRQANLEEKLEEKLQAVDEKLKAAVSWVKWSVGVSVAAIATLLATVLAKSG